MNFVKALLFTVFLTLSASLGADGETPPSVTPKGGFVPNQETAIQIAVAVWTPIYGKDQIEREKPYTATLKDGVWHVSGHLPENMLGGVAIAEVQQSDARILRVSHGR